MRLATVVGRILVSNVALFMVRREGLQRTLRSCRSCCVNNPMYAAEHYAARLSSPEILLGNWRRTTAMPRLLLLTGVFLPMANYAFAQDSRDPTPMQCKLIRSAVAQYGFAAARQHALETYGPEAVKTGDKCFTKQEGRDTSSYAPAETEPPGKQQQQSK